MKIPPRSQPPNSTRIISGALAAALLLCSGRAATPTPAELPSRSPISDYLGEMLEPVMIMGAGAGAFWIEARRWPASPEELAAWRANEGDWKNTLAKFSAVAFSPQPDGSLDISGTMSPPKLFAGRKVQAGPATFSARVIMRRAPGLAAGWKPHVEASLLDAKEKLKQVQ